MHALLILAGLGLILAGCGWLCVSAFGTNLLWGIASLIPGLNLVYALRYWQRARKAMVLCALGVIPLVVGLTVMASKDMERLQALVSLNWQAPPVPAADGLKLNLHGEFEGHSFAPIHGSLIDGVLSLRESDNFFARREVRIELGQQPEGELHLTVLPTDTGKLPVVEINWRLADQPLPEARRLSHGYTLNLDLVPEAPNKLIGSIHLDMPVQMQTLISGDIELFDNRLRYQDGRVDRHFDSRDTLTYVIDDYLQRRARTTDVQLQALPDVAFPSHHLELPIVARVHGHTESMVMVLDKPDLSGWIVAQDRFPPLELIKPAPPAALVSTPEPTSEKPPAPDPEPQGPAIDRRTGFTLQALQANPEQYRNLTLRALTDTGASAEGRFMGLDPIGRLVIQRVRNGQGGASFNLLPASIIEIELLEP